VKRAATLFDLEFTSKVIWWTEAESHSLVVRCSWILSSLTWFW